MRDAGTQDAPGGSVDGGEWELDMSGNPVRACASGACPTEKRKGRDVRYRDVFALG